MKPGDVREHKGQGHELLLLLGEVEGSHGNRRWWVFRLEEGSKLSVAEKWLLHDTRPYPNDLERVTLPPAAGGMGP